VFDDIRIDDLIRDLEVEVARLPKLPHPAPGFPPPRASTSCRWG
jgi:hypothetical protein